MDYCFMKYLNMGVSGAALATVISQSISGIACVIFCLFKRKEMIVSVSDFSFRENKFGDLMPQGISMSMISPVTILPTLPPAAASGEICPMLKPDVPPEKRPSVMRAQALPKCFDLIYEVG